MLVADLSAPPKLDARSWARVFSRYRGADGWRAGAELAITAAPFIAIWLVMAWALHAAVFWLYALCLPAAALLLVRLFMIQHDCGHGSFLPGRASNHWLGRTISIFTLTPYDLWRRSHNIHHATSGNLGSRGIGDIDTLTVAEYLARSRRGRWRYRAYRHPVVMFGIGPAYLFLLQNRLPSGFMRKGWRPWFSTMATNLAILLAAGLTAWATGWQIFLLIQLPVVLLGAAAGVWLFYVQHQFQETFWARGEAWTAHDAALQGSSHYDLPWPLNWFTANIGIHHVHHLSNQIPYYRLPQVLQDHPAFHALGRLTLRRSLHCVRLVLWDEQLQRLISFKDLGQIKLKEAAAF